jgi:glycosyltransferase involved in cell wall biosynthesis
MSGGEQSLLEMLAGLEERVQPLAATPPGRLYDALQARGVPVCSIPGTDGSLKPHPLHTPRTVAELVRAARSLRRIARIVRADLIHANSVRAGIVAAAAARLGGPPAVVHVRDVLPDGPLTRLSRAAVGAGAAAVVGNSAYTLERFTESRRHVIRVVAYSPIDLDRLAAASRLDQAAARAALGIPPDTGPVLGVVAQLTPWKGQDDAVRIVAGLRRAHPEARLLLAGSAKFVSRSTRHDNTAFVKRLRSTIDLLGLRDRVTFLGERGDVPELLRALDMLLVPSWEEPFGRTVVEALAASVPVAATSVGGPAEVITHGVEGLLLPPRQPTAWVTALSPLLASPARLAELARRGRRRSADFGRAEHADRLLALYEEVLAVSSNGARRRASAAPPVAVLK